MGDKGCQLHGRQPNGESGFRSFQNTQVGLRMYNVPKCGLDCLSIPADGVEIDPGFLFLETAENSKALFI